MEKPKELTLAMVGEDLMIYDLASSSIYILNKTATIIYQQLKERKDPSEIVLFLNDRYPDTDTNVLFSEVDKSKLILEELGLVTTATSFKEGSFLISPSHQDGHTDADYTEPKITVYTEEELKNRYADVFATSVVFGDLWTDIGGGGVVRG